MGDQYRIPCGFKIVGYFPSWSGEPGRVDYRALTHINYAFVGVTQTGCYGPVSHPEKLDALVWRAHAAGVKVLASIGGWDDGTNSGFMTTAADPDLTAAFVENTMALLARYDLDGLDVDWEFPNADSADAYARFMHELSIRLHAEGKLLTAAVSVDCWHGDSFRDSVISDVDFLNVMAYDGVFGLPPSIPHSSYEFAQAAMNYWLITRRVEPSKVVLGLPFYGRNLVNRRPLTYRTILSRDRNAPGKDVSRGYAYNGFDTIRAKTLQLARARGGGVMIWQLNQDAPGELSLLNAIFDAVKEPIVTAAPAPATPAGDTIPVALDGAR